VVLAVAVRLAVKAAVVEPAATETDVGIEAFVVPPPSATVVPPVGAGADKPTVQVAAPGVVTVDGVQENEVTVDAITLETGWLPDATPRVRSSETLLPTAADPEERIIVSCPNPQLAPITKTTTKGKRGQPTLKSTRSL
jgi:hypothetical protein